MSKTAKFMAATIAFALIAAPTTVAYATGCDDEQNEEGCEGLPPAPRPEPTPTPEPTPEPTPTPTPTPTPEPTPEPEPEPEPTPEPPTETETVPPVVVTEEPTPTTSTPTPTQAPAPPTPSREITRQEIVTHAEPAPEPPSRDITTWTCVENTEEQVGTWGEDGEPVFDEHDDRPVTQIDTNGEEPGGEDEMVCVSKEERDELAGSATAATLRAEQAEADADKAQDRIEQLERELAEANADDNTEVLSHGEEKDGGLALPVVGLLGATALVAAAMLYRRRRNNGTSDDEVAAEA